MAKRVFDLGILAIVLVFGVVVTGCDNDTTSSSNNNQNQPTLQQAITWSTERTITTADGQSLTLAQIGGQTAVNNALTQAWNSTYQNNPSAWTEARWRAIMSDAIVNGFSPQELPFKITQGKQFDVSAILVIAVKNPLGAYMRG